MKAIDRIWKALNHEEPDRVPTFTQSIEPNFIRRYDDEIEIEGEEGIPLIDLQLAKELGYDSKWVHWGGFKSNKRDMPEVPKELEDLVKNRRISTSGALHESNDVGSWYVDGLLKTPEIIRDWIDYVKSFEIDGPKYYDEFKRIYDYCLEYDLVPIPTAGGPTYTVWSSIGMNRFGYMLRKYPNLVKSLLNAWTDLTIEQHQQFFERDIPFCFICDDHAFKDRIMMSPKQFKEFIVPIFKRLSNNAHKYNAKFLLHTDGMLWEEMDLLVEAGVDAVEPLEYEAGNRLKPLKEKYGDKMTLFGNVAASDVICFGTVEETIKATKQCILDAAEGGGLILSQGANLLNDSKIENVKAMIETVKKFGNYPIDKSKLK